jgi:hypothetical protein
MDILLILLVVAVALVAFTVVRRRRHNAITASRVNELRAIVDEDITQFGGRLARFDVNDPRLDDDGRAQLQRALDDYTIARSAAERMRTESDTGRVTSALEDGRYALACLEARLDSRPEPQRRPPCFLDPGHGPSTEELPWSVDGRPAEPTPMCVGCASTVRRGGVPEPRRLPVGPGGERVPWYSAGREYATPYAAGYYSPFAAVMPALFMGTMMGALMMPGFDMNGSYDAGYQDGLDAGGGDAAGDAGGDFGGGDFGGGDFGGGDFGGF